MKRLSLYGLMALHVGLAAATYVFSKKAAVGFSNPEALTLSRALGAAVIFLLLSGWAIPKPAFGVKDWLKILGIGILLVPANQYCFLRGLQHTVPSHSALFYALTPLGVLLMVSTLRRRLPPLEKTLGVLLALAGVATVLRPWETGGFASELRSGDFWNLAAVLCWIIYTVAVKGMCRGHDPRVVTAWSLIAGALAMLPLAGHDLLTFNFAALEAGAWLGLVWLVLIASVIMMLVWNILLRHLEPEAVAVCANAQPPATAALSAFLAWAGLLASDQDLSLLFFMGMVLIIGGVWLVQRSGPPFWQAFAKIAHPK
ncbi:MAG: DMT family transporter [Thermodesulfobacteriota bacterium]